LSLKAHMSAGELPQRRTHSYMVRDIGLDRGNCGAE